MKNPFIFSFILFFASPIICNAQSITAFPDTVICSLEPVTLYAVVDGIWGTESYTYEIIPFAPEPISGEDITMIDDTHTGPYNIEFDFCFFGETYDEFYLASNGWISFIEPESDWDFNWTPDGPIPDGAFNVPKAAIFGPWEDWDTGLCTNCIWYETVGTAPNRKLIITWDDVPLFLCTSDKGTFQIVLHETTNIIDNHLIEIPSCPSWGGGFSVEGIQNEDGDEAFAAPDRNHDVWETEDESNRWVPNSISWFETATGTFLGTGDTLIVNPFETTSYTAEVTLCDGTTVSDEVIITISAPYEVDSVIENISCYEANDGFIHLSISGNTSPMTFLWSNGETTEDIDNLPPGIYTVTIEEFGGCITLFEIEITEPQELSLAIADQQDVTCFDGFDGFILLDPEGGTIPYSFALNEDNEQSDSLFLSLTAGNYLIEIIDANGCDTLIETTISQPEELVVDAGQNKIIPYGASTQINAITNAISIDQIVWTPETDLSCLNCLNPEATPLLTTNYLITVTDEFGCVATDEITIVVEVDITIPNVFTPNGDGLNDFFHVSEDFIESFEMNIYSRWGEIVYTSFLQDRGWDGFINGKPAEIGSFQYVIRATTKSNEEIGKNGSILLLR